MHHVERHPGYALGEADDPAEGQVLGQRIVHFRHVLEADAPLGDQLGVHVHDDVVVLGMDDAEAAGAGERLEHLPDVAEPDHPPLARRRDVGGEDLHRGVARLDHLGDLGHDLSRNLTLQHDVVRVVAAAFAGPVLVPPLDRLADALPLVPDGEVDERRGPAVERRPADHVGTCGIARAAVRHRHRPLAMDMRVDAARDHQLAGGVDRPGRRIAPEGAGGGDGGDLLAGDGDVGDDRAGRRDDGSAADEQVQHL